MRPLDQFSVREQGTWDKGQEKPFAIHQSPLSLAWHEPSLPRFRRLKSALKFCAINYGLKSAAWLAFALPLPAHAIGFSQ
jgi:hypothetical protein